MYPYLLFTLIAYMDKNVNIGLLLLCYEPELLCELCTTNNNNNNNLYLYSALIQFVSKALYNEVHNMHRKHKSNKKTLLPISKLLISGVIYHGKLG